MNHFAQPLSSAGGTRHVEIFGKLENWDHRIVAANISYMGRDVGSDDQRFVTVPVLKHSGNGIMRVANWASFSVGALAKGIFGKRPTVVYGSSPHMGAALAGWMIAKVRRAGFVLEVRDLWPAILVEAGIMTEQSRIFRSLKVLERFLYHRADSIIILAEGSADYIVAEGIEPQKLVFIPNGADPEFFAIDEPRESMRDELGFNGFSVVYAGAHGPANGLDYVLEAAARLTDVDVQFHLIGDGVSKDGLVRSVAGQGLSNVHFHDPVEKSLIPRIFAAADAGLHCLAPHDLFTKGVSPNKLYDYMAAGLPIITNTRGEVAELVQDADSGLAVGPSEIEAAVRALVSASVEQRARYGDNGQEWMRKNRSRSSMAQRIEAVLENASK